MCQLTEYYFYPGNYKEPSEKMNVSYIDNGHQNILIFLDLKDNLQWDIAIEF